MIIEDLDILFSDTSVPVVSGLKKYLGLFEEAGSSSNEFMSINETPVVIMKTSDVDLIKPSQGDEINVDSRDFYIHSFHKVEDGKLTKILLDKK